MTMTPTPLERLRAHTTLALAERRDQIAATRRRISELAARDDVHPEAFVQDLRVYVHRITQDASAALVLEDALAGLNSLEPVVELVAAGIDGEVRS